ncbi:MAG: acetate kinase [Gammaproteobacteria bacterium]|jgi:acetate kinase
MDLILVLNCGSASVKFALFASDSQGTDALCEGMASRVNEPGQGHLRWRSGERHHDQPLPGSGDHRQAIASIAAQLREQGWLGRVQAVGHRVVHGGDQFRAPALVTPAVEAAIEHFGAYAPLHNPVNLLGIRLCQQHLPGIPQVAVFDTAFHSTLPPEAYHYAVPEAWHRDWGVRRYGFHGINHHYISKRLPVLLQQPVDQVRAVSAHLGNGCSLCAIKGAISVDTSMGFTPLEGLMMGSRCGDLDPGLHEYLCDRLNIDIRTLTGLLNKEAGLKGVSGVGSDMRQCLQAADDGHPQAQLAVELFCYRLAKHIAGYIVPLGAIDTIVFTAGIGEHAAPIRARVITLLHGLGFRLDHDANQQPASHDRNIAVPGTPPILVIPAREEWLIARQSALLLETQGAHP